MHTKTTDDNVKCDRGLGDLVRAYAAEHACSVNAQTAIWTRLGSTVGGTHSQQANPMVPYSNLIGGWLGFWQSRRMLHFADAWHRWPDGWLYRWTDQQFWLVAMAALNVSEAHMAYIPGWRYKRFEHTKLDHFCDQPKVAKNLSDPCARKVQQAGRWVYTAACLAQRGG